MRRARLTVVNALVTRVLELCTSRGENAHAASEQYVQTREDYRIRERIESQTAGGEQAQLVAA